MQIDKMHETIGSILLNSYGREMSGRFIFEINHLSFKVSIITDAAE